MGPVVIGPREIYDILVDVRDKVGDLASDRDTHAEGLADLRARMAKVERLVWIAAGAAAVVGGALARIFDIGGV